MKKFGKKLLTFVMTFAMVAGVWGGMEIDVRADGEGTLSKNGKEIVSGDIINAGETVDVKVPDDVTKIGIVCSEYYLENGVPTTNEHGYTGHDGVTKDYQSGETRKTFTFPEFVSELTHKNYTKYRYGKSARYNQSSEWLFFVYLVDDSEEVVPGGNTSGGENNPTKENGNVSSESTSPNSRTSDNVASHTCNFEWTIKIDPTTGADGLEEYKCAGCGAVKESHSIPASVAVIKDFYGNVKEAPENGSITYDSGKLYTISDYLLKKMAERKDVTVTIQFEYQGAKYELTFPAGMDYSTVLTDEETMYGYFGVAAKLGLKVVAK